ncbi:MULTISPECIES: cytochrome c oxidase subunit CcoM [Halomonas]|nr:MULTISPECIES: cytochrome c oxidase subunit CcoM [Halomonas]MED5296874.1 cytochrome c oxidase subunit CcoM [Pseudomonadota bacterium]
MYLDDAVIFGLGAVALSVVFMAGWIAFVIRDSHRRKR